MIDPNRLYDYTIDLDEDGDAVLTHNCGAELGEVHLESLGDLAETAERHDCGNDEAPAYTTPKDAADQARNARRILDQFGALGGNRE